MALVRRSLAVAALVAAMAAAPATGAFTGRAPRAEACSGSGDLLLNSAPVSLYGTIKLWQNCGTSQVHADMQNNHPGIVWVAAELTYGSSGDVGGDWTQAADANTPAVWAGHICYTAGGSYYGPNGEQGSNTTTACV